MFRTIAAVVLIAAPAAFAQDHGRTLQHQAVIHAPAGELWDLWTTAEGWKRFGVAQAEVDFRIGGQIRTHYSADGVLGDDGTIINTILAYEPERMLAIRATAPKNAPEFIHEICKTGWSVIRLEPLSPTTTRLIITGMGYGEGELHDQAYAFFDRGNAYTLEILKQSFPGAEAQATAAGELLEKLKGEWEFNTTRPDGSVFRGRTSVHPLFGGKLLMATGTLGNEQSMFHHSHWIAGKDGASGQYRLHSWNQNGDLSTGEFRVPSPDTLAFDWDTVQLKDGKRVAYSGEYVFIDDDTYDCIIYQPAPELPEGRKVMVKVRYVRCAPETAPLSVTGESAGR